MATTTCCWRYGDWQLRGSFEAIVTFPDPLILINPCINPCLPMSLSIPQLNPTGEDTHLSLWLARLLALYSMWTLPRVCFCVGDFSTCSDWFLVVCHPSPFFTSYDLNVCVPLFSTFQCFSWGCKTMCGHAWCDCRWTWPSRVWTVCLSWYLISFLCCQVPTCHCTGTNWWKHWARPGYSIWMFATRARAVHCVFLLHFLICSCAILCNVITVFVAHL